MVLIEENTVPDLIDEYGSVIILRKRTGDTYNTRGDIIEGTSVDLSTKAIVNNIGFESKYFKEGIYSGDDKVFFMAGTSSVIRGDTIEHSSKEYTVDNIISSELEDYVHVLEVYAKLI